MISTQNFQSIFLRVKNIIYDNNDDPVEDNDKLFLMYSFSKMMTLMVIRESKNICMAPSFQFEFDKAKHLEK